MAELDLRDGAPEQAIARIERTLASIAADAVLPADHAWIGEAYLLLGRAHAQRNDAERAKAAEANKPAPSSQPCPRVIRCGITWRHPPPDSFCVAETRERAGGRAMPRYRAMPGAPACSKVPG
jgi:hypothetical protein